jgi:N-acetylglucosamine-6-sulfatase
VRRLVLLLALLLVFACPVGAQEGTTLPEQPNIIFVLTDDQERSTLAHMDEVQSNLVAQGKTFDEAVFTYPLCCPSRATIQSGLYPHNHGVLNNGPPEGGFERFAAGGHDQNTVALWLDQAGYETGYFGRYLNNTPIGAQIPGWDEFSHYVKAPGGMVEFRGGKPVAESRVDSVVASQATRFLEQAGEEPFFAFVSMRAPHAPYEHPGRYARLFKGVQAPRTPDMNEADVSDKPTYVSTLKPVGMREIDGNYRQALRSLQVTDRFVGDAIRILEEKDELHNTYIFFYTDNGTHLGYHRLPYGKRTPYERDVTFPLLVRGPGVEAGSVNSALIGNHDVAATLSELAGVQAPTDVDGRSFAPMLYGEAAPWREAILMQGRGTRGSGMPPWFAVRTERWKYVAYENGERELYDLRADPYEVENLAGTMPEVEDELSVRLETLKGCVAETCRSAEGP